MNLDGDFTPEEFDKARRMEEHFAARSIRWRRCDKHSVVYQERRGCWQCNAEKKGPGGNP